MESQGEAAPIGKKRWAIVLSGGEGERLRAMTERWLGRHRPKQYCTFVGSRTMLEHTLDRAVQLVGADRVVTVIGRGHRAFVDESTMPGKVIEQPVNLDTAPGILLGMTYIEAHEPGATAVIFPSDHFISPEKRFLQHVDRAALLAERLAGRLILLGAYPDRPETEFGWIEPGVSAGPWSWSARQVAHEVVSFREKPTAMDALDCFARGFLWNTMIMAAGLALIRTLAQAYLPHIAARFEKIRRFWATASPAAKDFVEREALTLIEAYQGLPRANFSQSILQRCPEATVVLPMGDVEWSDWGKPERIGETLQRLSKTAVVPLEYLTVG